MQSTHDLLCRCPADYTPIAQLGAVDEDLDDPAIAKKLWSQSEKLVDANFQQLKAWKAEFEKSNGRPPSKADILLADKEILNLARRLGDLG